jgi:DNA-binding HxlR family transcriptional regulator
LVFLSQNRIFEVCAATGNGGRESVACLYSFASNLVAIYKSAPVTGQERTGISAANMEVSMTKRVVEKQPASGLLCGHEDPIAFRELLTRIGDKWSIFTLLALSMLPGEHARFSELNRVIGSISEKMLSLTLRNLERDGLVTREVFAEVPPRVEYELTSLSRSLLPGLQGLVDWVSLNSEQVKVARDLFDARTR